MTPFASHRLLEQPDYSINASSPGTCFSASFGPLFLPRVSVLDLSHCESVIGETALQ
jgi:hypothetical protein